MADRIPIRNAEGYLDPTAHSALSNVMRAHDRQSEADQRPMQLIRALKGIIDLAGFDLLCRIEVRDRATGKIYK